MDPSRILARFGASGATTIGGDPRFADFLVKLKADGKLDSSIVPSLFINQVYVVDDETERLALDANVGDVAKQVDDGSVWMLATTPASDNGNWILIGDVQVTADEVTVDSSLWTTTMNTEVDVQGVLGVVDSLISGLDSGKVTKSSSNLIVYGTDNTGTQTTYGIINTATANTIVKRDASGNFQVNDPTANSHPASKQYVDEVAAPIISLNFSQLSSMIGAGTVTPGRYYQVTNMPVKYDRVSDEGSSEEVSATESFIVKGVATNKIDSWAVLTSNQAISCCLEFSSNVPTGRISRSIDRDRNIDVSFWINAQVWRHGLEAASIPTIASFVSEEAVGSETLVNFSGTVRLARYTFTVPNTTASPRLWEAVSSLAISAGNLFSINCQFLYDYLGSAATLVNAVDASARDIVVRMKPFEDLDLNIVGSNILIEAEDTFLGTVEGDNLTIRGASVPVDIYVRGSDSSITTSGSTFINNIESSEIIGDFQDVVLTDVRRSKIYGGGVVRGKILDSEVHAISSSYYSNTFHSFTRSKVFGKILTQSQGLWLTDAEYIAPLTDSGWESTEPVEVEGGRLEVVDGAGSYRYTAVKKLAEQSPTNQIKLPNTGSSLWNINVTCNLRDADMLTTIRALFNTLGLIGDQIVEPQSTDVLTADLEIDGDYLKFSDFAVNGEPQSVPSAVAEVVVYGHIA